MPIDKNRVLNSLTIIAATEGGCVVWGDTLTNDPGMVRSPLFAGSLEECLAFISKHWGEPPDLVVSTAMSGGITWVSKDDLG